MASEVRMLEDRIWEYDAAYREKDSEYDRLVQEVARLKSKNSELQRKQTTQKHDQDDVRLNPARPLRLKPDQGEKTQVEPLAVPSNQYEIPPVLVPETIANPPLRTTVTPPTPTNKNPAPSVEELLPPPGGNAQNSPRSLLEKANGTEEPQAANGIRLQKKKSNLPDPGSLTEQVSLPDSIVRSARQPKLTVAPDVRLDSPSTTMPAEKAARPNMLPTLLRRLPTIRDAETQGSSQSGRIQLPEGSKVQFASANETTAPRKSNQTIDQRMVEIAFHPTMCRGHNFDEKPGDDGLYLVVTPLNAEGQVINQIGTLTVIAEDPTSKENPRIGAWEFSSEQLAEILEPSGTSQGFHLSLPWPDKSPTCKVVSVYLLFNSDNGRKLVNQRDIHLRVHAFEQQVWTPRKTTDSK